MSPNPDKPEPKQSIFSQRRKVRKEMPALLEFKQ